MLGSSGDHSFELSPRPKQFYLSKGPFLWREGPRSSYLHMHQACLYLDSTIPLLVFVQGENWMSFQHLAGSLPSNCLACHLVARATSLLELHIEESLDCSTDYPALYIRWPGALDTFVPFGLPPEKGAKSS